MTEDSGIFKTASSRNVLGKNDSGSARSASSLHRGVVVKVRKEQNSMTERVAQMEMSYDRKHRLSVKNCAAGKVQPFMRSTLAHTSKLQHQFSKGGLLRKQSLTPNSNAARLQGILE